MKGKRSLFLCHKCTIGLLEHCHGSTCPGAAEVDRDSFCFPKMAKPSFVRR